MPIPQPSPGHRPTDQRELAVAPEVAPDPEKKQNEVARGMNTAWAWTGRNCPQKARSTTSRSKCTCQKTVTSFLN